MVNGITTGDTCGFNRGRNSKFGEGYRVRQISEVGQRTYQPKSCGNKYEENSRKTLMIKTIKFRLKNLDNYLNKTDEDYRTQCLGKRQMIHSDLTYNNITIIHRNKMNKGMDHKILRSYWYYTLIFSYTV